MTVKTKFTEDELSRIFTNYDLGDYISSLPLSGGTVQTNIKVLTSQGPFVFRYYENRTEQSVMFETELLLFLKTQHYPCAGPLSNHSGGCIGIHNSKPYVIFEYMEGQHLNKPNERQKNQLIHKAAELHSLTTSFAPTHKDARWNYSRELCRELAVQASKRMNTAHSMEKLDWLKNELHGLELPESLPKGICHSDFNFSNVLYKQGEFSALLDFDDANYTYLLFDVVGLVQAWAWRYDQDAFLNFSEAKKVLLEYSRYRPLSDVEKHHLFDVLKLSILFDCVWYFNRGAPPDFYEKKKIDLLNRFGREAFHQELFH